MSDRGREFSELSSRIIGCAIEAHRVLGPGLLESAYQHCLAREFSLNEIPFALEVPIPVEYKGLELDCGYRADVLVNGEILLELKVVERVSPIHSAQLLSYMKLAGIHQGFLINCNSKRLKDGLRSFVL